ncbi:MAG: DUF6340 family protein [Dysgonomonas sp.]|nr:DUF6340 family protein [Dysgonomonas sp.]
MKRLLYLATLLAIALSYTACRSVNTVVVEVQKPAQIILPKTINNIGIVDNAIPQPDTWGHYETRYSEKGTKKLEEVSVPGDSNIIYLTEALFKNLAELDHFENISLYEFPLRQDLSFEEERPVDSITVKEIAQITNSDALISIDRFLISSTLREEPFDFETKLKFLDLKMDVRFRIWSKEGKQISSPFYLTDSIYWSGVYKNKTVISEDSLPTRINAAKEGAEYIAEKLAKAFTHSWQEIPRVYYGDVKAANKKVEANDWTGALKLWEEAYNKESKPKKKARIANNIALAYEISDDIKNALKWVQTSLDIFTETAENSIDQQYIEAAQYYKNALLERHQEFRLLDLRDKEKIE